MQPRRRDGFTLIELLIAVGIVALLVGVATPLLSLSRRNAYQANTQSILHRVANACQQFKNDTTGFPYREWDLATNPPPAANTTPPTNLLALRLARTMDDAYRAKLIKSGDPGNPADLEAATAAYTYGGSAYVPAASMNQPNMQGWTSTGFLNVTAIMSTHLNLLARRWAAANIMIGNMALKRTQQNGASAWVPSATSVLGTPLSQGFGDDYLGPWLPKRTLVGDEICDTWGTPLLYICPVQPGVKGFYPYGGSNLLDPGWYGMGARSLRSATTSLTSDLRNSAIAAHVFQFEIWSIGPDAKVSSTRDSTTRVNDDNIGAADYLKGLQ
jgi:prepilin-type N-terminal cleavage/methylation domain-containing protein